MSSVAMHILRTLIAYCLVLGTLTAPPYSNHFPFTNGGCYPLWSRYQDGCYRLFGEPMTWQDAEDYCQRYEMNKQGAHLASIHGKKENDFVYQLWQSTVTDPGLDDDDFEPDVNRANGLWIGLTDQLEESSWYWTDNSTTHGFSNWRWYQPNNDDWDGTGVGEDCVHIFKHSYPYFWWYGDWNDVACDRLLPFVCRTPIDDGYSNE